MKSGHGRSAAARKDPIRDLLEYIRRQAFRRGDRLPPIRQLAEVLGHGANSIRDSVLQAQTMGVVKIEPRLGIFVQNPERATAGDDAGEWLPPSLAGGEQNAFYLMEARMLLEVEFAAKVARSKQHEPLLPLRAALDKLLATDGERLGVVEADENFHLAIAKAAGNPVLFDLLRAVLAHLRPAKVQQQYSPEDRAQIDREHVRIYQAIAEGHADQAATAMREHLDRGRVLLLDRLRRLPPPG